MKAEEHYESNYIIEELICSFAVTPKVMCRTDFVKQFRNMLIVLKIALLQVLKQCTSQEGT